MTKISTAGLQAPCSEPVGLWCLKRKDAPKVRKGTLAPLGLDIFASLWPSLDLGKLLPEKGGDRRGKISCLTPNRRFEGRRLALGIGDLTCVIIKVSQRGIRIQLHWLLPKTNCSGRRLTLPHSSAEKGKVVVCRKMMIPGIRMSESHSGCLTCQLCDLGHIT